MRSRRKVLREMQSKEPKKYWTFLNSLKTKKMAKASSVDAFYDFFKDVYCADDDKTEDEMPFNLILNTLMKLLTAGSQMMRF